MNQDKIGKFILDLRKKHNMPQSQFAEKLNVTAQAVSKWENGRGIPDIELLKKISDEFDVDISEILTGEIKRKKHQKYIIFSIIIFILIAFFTVYYLLDHNDFQFKSLSSNNNDFNVKGVAAYSSDRKSIYISKIEYLGEDKSDEKFFMLDCALYEKNNDIEKKIASCLNDINQGEDELKPFQELLDAIEFNINNYESTCKDIATDSLYIFISALDVNNKTVTYKVPLKIEDKCN